MGVLLHTPIATQAADTLDRTMLWVATAQLEALERELLKAAQGGGAVGRIREERDQLRRNVCELRLGYSRNAWRRAEGLQAGRQRRRLCAVVDLRVCELGDLGLDPRQQRRGPHRPAPPWA